MELRSFATVWPHHGTPAEITPGAPVCRDNDLWFFLTELPEGLEGSTYLDSRCRDVTSAVVTDAGWVYILTPADGFSKSQEKHFAEEGYAVTERYPVGTLIAGTQRDMVLLEKYVQPGERIRGEAWCVLLAQVCQDYVPVVTDDRSLKAPEILLDPQAPEYQHGNQAWQGIPSIGRGANGRLWAAWYGGSTDENEYNWCVLYTSDDDGNTWKGPKAVVQPRGEFVRAFDPNLWTDPKGRLWFIWNQSYFHFDGRAGVWAMYTEDPDSENPVWSQPQRLCDGIVMCDPVVLKNGDWLLPTAIWGWGICEEMARDRHSNAYISRDEGATWQYAGSVQKTEGRYNCDENMIIEQEDGSLRMLVRSMLGIEESFSRDGGFTWTDAVDAHISQVVSRFYITRLTSGRQLLIFNDPPEGGNVRSHMTAALSEDDGATWPYRLVLDEREGISYPDALEADGFIYAIYDRNRYTDQEILMAKFTEADILAGKLANENSRLKILVDSK